MREAIKRIVLRLFPELACGLHLDRYAKIIKISDPPTNGVTCDRFRPYFAADIEILTPEGEPAKGFPKYEAVPLPLPMAGDSEGFFLWPRPGAIVTVRWIEGRPDHPVIQHVYPMGLTLPDLPDNMARWQQREGVHQTVDPDGNWERKTDQEIRDIAAQVFRATAPKIVLRKDGGPSVLPCITDAFDGIISALNTIATHDHGGNQPTQGAGVTSGANEVSTASTDLKTLQE